MKVKRSLLLVAVGCGAVALAFQAGQKKYVILDDKKGGFKIYDVESVLGTFEPNGDYGFEATGTPMRGFSKQQGLVFSANAVDGTASRTAEGSFRIKSAKASGSVVADVNSDNTDGSNTKSHIESGSMTLSETESAATITFPGAFTFTNHLVSSTVDRNIEVRAPSGTFVLPPLNQSSGTNNPFRSADVRGPVNVTIDSKRKGADGVTRQVVKVKGDKMTYNGETRIMRLEGNITADLETTLPDGTNTGLVTTVEWVTIELDENSALKLVRTGAGRTVGKDGGGN
jgi:hypothetical protein